MIPHKRLVPICCIILLMVAGCSETNATQSTSAPSINQIAGVLPIPPKDAPMPRLDKASISGVLYSYSLPHVLGQTMFYLTPAVGTDRRDMPSLLLPPNQSKGDIQTVTDPNGQFALADIAPGNYYLIVWAPFDWIPAQTSRDNPSPLLIELEPNQRKALGILYLAWQ